MEWIKLFACFYNMEDEVIAYLIECGKIKDIEEGKGLEQSKVS